MFNRISEISDKDYLSVCDAGLGDFVRSIPGDRTDTSYEVLEPGAVEAAKRMPAEHKLVLRQSAVARAAVKEAYSSSPRKSDAVLVLLVAVTEQFRSWETAQKIIETYKPSISVLDMLREMDGKTSS